MRVSPATSGRKSAPRIEALPPVANGIAPSRHTASTFSRVDATCGET
jgi:hypothetical protein